MTELPEMSALKDGHSRSIIGSCQNNDIGTLGWDNDHRNSCEFDVEAWIYPNIEHACSSTCSDIWCVGPNWPKSWKTYLHKSS